MASISDLEQACEAILGTGFVLKASRSQKIHWVKRITHIEMSMSQALIDVIHPDELAEAMSAWQKHGDKTLISRMHKAACLSASAELQKEHMNKMKGPGGKHHDLKDILFDLANEGLVDLNRLSGWNIVWNPKKNKTLIGQCNHSSKVISISSILDDADMPRSVISYVIYHEYCHVLHPEDGHGFLFRSEEMKFPHVHEQNMLLCNSVSNAVYASSKVVRT